MTNSPITKGDRIELVSTNDPYTALMPGEKGTVNSVRDSMGDQIIEVDWDCGSALSMIPAEGDRFRIL